MLEKRFIFKRRRKRNGDESIKSYSSAMATELPDFPRELVTALQATAQTFKRRSIRYALTGGLATGYRSRPRFTRDLDFLADVPQMVLPGLLDDLRSQGFSF